MAKTGRAENFNPVNRAEFRPVVEIVHVIEKNFQLTRSTDLISARG
jgi:hypothetical protein